MFRFRVCAAAIAAIVISATASAQTPAEPTADSPLQIKPPAPAEKVVAKVGDEEITNTQLDRVIDRVIQGQFRGRPVPPEMMPQFRKSVLESMIQSKLVSQFVAAKKIEVKPEEVDEAIADFKKAVAQNKLEFSAVLKSQGMSEESLKKQIASDMAVEKYVKDQVSDAQAEEYFKAHKKDFEESFEPKVRASHILLAYEPDATAEEKKAANDKIAAIRQEIVGGADFAEAAKKHSACPSKEQGGDLDFFTREQMVKPFSDAAFSMKPGDISQPVETQFGVHLIKVTDVQSEVTFAGVKETVLETLYQQLLEKAVEEQRKITKVEILGS